MFVRPAVAVLAAGLCVLGATPASAGPIASSTYVWQLEPVPGPHGAPVRGLYYPPSLACPRANWCEILTDLEYLTTLDGRTATTVRAPVYTEDPYASGGLSSLACAGLGSCVATGSWAEGPWDQPTGYRYELSGGTWQPEAGATAWMDVACNPDRCVETANLDEGIDRAVLDERDATGTWVSRPVVTPWQVANDHGYGAGLDAVDCAPSGPCYAVGHAQDSQHNVHSLFFSRIGRAWRGVPVAGPQGAADPDLALLSCPAPHTCIALGSYFDGSENHVFAERIAHGVMTTMAVPMPAATWLDLNALDCATPTDCAGAASWEDAAGKYHSSLLRYHAGRWSADGAAVPHPGSGPNVAAISCASAIRCEAVGSYAVRVDGRLIVRPAVWTWFPPGWTVQALGHPRGTDGGDDSGLTGVECRSDSRCVAVGYYGGEHGPIESIYAVGRLSD